MKPLPKHMLLLRAQGSFYLDDTTGSRLGCLLASLVDFRCTSPSNYASKESALLATPAANLIGSASYNHASKYGYAVLHKCRKVHVLDQKLEIYTLVLRCSRGGTIV